MERLVRYLAGKAQTTMHLDSERAEVVEYGIFCIIMFVVTVAGLAVASAATCGLSTGLAAAAAGAFLRNFSGGVHYSTPGACAVMTSLSYPLFAWAAQGLSGTGVAGAWLPAALGAVSSVFVWMYAPVDSPAKPISKTRAKRLRRQSVAIALSWTALTAIAAATGATRLGMMLAMSSGIFWQSLTLTKVGKSLQACVDGCAARISGVCRRMPLIDRSQV